MTTPLWTDWESIEFDWPSWEPLWQAYLHANLMGILLFVALDSLGFRQAVKALGDSYASSLRALSEPPRELP